MEIHQLRYFVAAAQSGNFTKAAERCHVSQPSLSQQILKLEDELGQRLFDRLSRRVLLTEAGQRFLDHARRILLAVGDAEREMEDGSDAGPGRLSVGVIPTVAPYLIPGAFGRLAARRPGVEVAIHEDFTHNVLAATVAGEIDMAVVALPLDDARLEVRPFYTEPLLAALWRGHRLASAERVTLKELREEPFILLSEMHCLGEQIASFCAARGFRPRVSCRSAQLSTVENLVESGLGVSLIPAMARSTGRGGSTVYKRVAGTPAPERTLAVAAHKDRYRSSLWDEFVDDLAETAREFAL